MLRVRQPKTLVKLIPITRDEDTKNVLDTCKGKDFIQVRDDEVIRLLSNTGARLSVVANLQLTDVDLSLDTVQCRGKGAEDRWVRLGPKTARALSRICAPAPSTAVSGCPTCGWPHEERDG